jgi:hypothetical protein
VTSENEETIRLFYGLMKIPPCGSNLTIRYRLILCKISL